MMKQRIGRARHLAPQRESGPSAVEFLDRTAIPNSHLKHQNSREGAGTAGMTLADANLLKIEVTHWVELKIPLINRLILPAMSELERLGANDPTKLAYYAAGRIPVTSTATVRMQSEAWKESIDLTNATPPPNVPGTSPC